MNPFSIEQKNAPKRCCPDFKCLYESWDGFTCPECGKECFTCAHYDGAIWNKRRHELKRKLWNLSYMCFLFGCNNTCPIYEMCGGKFKEQADAIVKELNK